MKFVKTFVAALLFSSTAFGQHLNEAEVVSAIAEKYEAQVEVKLWDNTRVDLLSATHAYEVDWAYKYAEGVGQALYYGCITERRPGLILLVKDLMQEQRFIYRARIACNKAAVDLYVEPVRQAAMQQPPVDDKPLYVYFVYDPEDDRYYRAGMLGLSGWSKITEADVWTVKKTAERTLSSMYGSRATRYVIKTFILIPSNE